LTPIGSSPAAAKPTVPERRPGSRMSEECRRAAGQDAMTMTGPATRGTFGSRPTPTSCALRRALLDERGGPLPALPLALTVLAG